MAGLEVAPRGTESSEKYQSKADDGCNSNDAKHWMADEDLERQFMEEKEVAMIKEVIRVTNELIERNNELLAYRKEQTARHNAQSEKHKEEIVKLEEQIVKYEQHTAEVKEHIEKDKQKISEAKELIGSRDVKIAQLQELLKFVKREEAKVTGESMGTQTEKSKD